MSFFGELKRRNVFRVAGVYAVVAWLLVQIAATVEEALELPGWFDTVALSFLAIGFPIALVFAWAFEVTPDGVKRTSDVTADDSITRHTGSKLDLVLIIALLVFAAAIVAPMLVGTADQAPSSADESLATEAQPNDPDLAAATAIGSADAKVNDASIAVLPFADLSPGGDQEYFADGVSEELLNVLAKVSGLKVAGRTSSFAFKGRNEDLREIGSVLNVAHILEGSVRSQGNKVRVTAQLIQVSDGFHLWSETYDGDLTDIFSVQDDIAQQILVAMTDQLLVEAPETLAPITRTDITAYGLFLEARDLTFSRDVAKMKRAMALLNQAIEIDPNYAPAYAARAQLYSLLSDGTSSYGDIPIKEALAAANADVQQALSLDPDLPEALAVLGLLSNDAGRPDFAIGNLRRSVELNPNSLDARNWLAMSLTDDGRFREALDQLEQLIDIDPLYAPGVNNAMIYAQELGDTDKANAIAERYVKMTDDPQEKAEYRGRIAQAEGRIAEAIGQFTSVSEVERDRTIDANLGFAYNALGLDETGFGVDDSLQAIRGATLASLGRMDEAVAIARELVAENPAYTQAQSQLVSVLSSARRDEALIAYFRETFDGSFDAFATRLRASSFAAPPPFAELAMAMRATGDKAGFERAMALYRQSIDTYRAGGAASGGRDLDDAAYWALVGNPDKSMTFLERAFKRNDFLAAGVLRQRALDALHADPRFIALREKVITRINEERALLDIPPLDADFFVR